MVVLFLALLFGTGCNQSSEQQQALKEQQQALEEQQKKNKKLQKELEAQKERQKAAKQEEMEQQIAALKKKVEKAGEPEETDQSEPESSNDDSPSDEAVVIETASPSEAPQGVVVVAPQFDVQAVTAEEAEAIDAAITYYQAVEIGDYYTTHSLLSLDDQALYPLDVWVESNTALDSAAGEFVVTDAYPYDLGTGYPAYAVEVTIYLPDGSTSYRTTYFTNEGNGYWAHWLSDEEMGMFSNAL